MGQWAAACGTRYIVYVIAYAFLDVCMRACACVSSATENLLLSQVDTGRRKGGLEENAEENLT